MLSRDSNSTFFITEDFTAARAITFGRTELGREGTSLDSEVAFDEPPFRWERPPDSLSNFQCREQVDDMFHIYPP